MSSTDQLLTPPQVGRVLGIDTVDVLVLIDEGQLARIKGEDGLIYVSASAVEAFRSTR